MLRRLCTRARRGRDRVVVAYTTTTNVVSLNPGHGEVYSIQHYVIKFVSDLRQVATFLRELRFPSLKRLTAMI
jgi:hypothetical protein